MLLMVPIMTEITMSSIDAVCVDFRVILIATRERRPSLPWILTAILQYCHFFYCVPASWPLESTRVVWDVKSWGRWRGGGFPEDMRAEVELIEEDDWIWSAGLIWLLAVRREHDAIKQQDVADGRCERNIRASFFRIRSKSKSKTYKVAC